MAITTPARGTANIHPNHEALGVGNSHYYSCKRNSQHPQTNEFKQVDFCGVFVFFLSNSRAQRTNSNRLIFVGFCIFFLSSNRATNSNRLIFVLFLFCFFGWRRLQTGDDFKQETTSNRRRLQTTGPCKQQTNSNRLIFLLIFLVFFLGHTSNRSKHSKQQGTNK